ncbi:flagellin FliC, partial [Lelliottia nimipressuralis]
SINTEITQRLSEIDRIAGGANFNGKSLLNGSVSTSLSIQVGAGTSANDTIKIDSTALINATSGTLSSTLSTSITDNSSAQTVISAADDAIAKIDG